MNLFLKSLRITLGLIVCFNSSLSLAKTGLPVPRFVSLRSNNINVRVGPGIRYPLEWVFVRKRTPVEIIAEFDAWRKIRDIEGAEGWVHKSMLSGVRTVLVLKGEHNLCKYPDESKQIIAKVQAGVIGKLLKCERKSCKVQIDNYKGWILRKHLWGIYKKEEIR